MFSILKKHQTSRQKDHETSRKFRYRPCLETLEARDVPALVVTPATPDAMVQSLLGNGVTVSNVSYTGADDAKAFVTGGTGIIGFESGIILSSGAAANVIGPNDDPGKSTDNGTPGDADLDAIVAPNTTNDAAVLEFDFVTQGSQLTFNYVFSSEEYNEFVNAGFNDVFAFFLNNVNVALLPNSTTPVSIDNVNNGLNSQFYIDNTDGHLDTQMDGLTVVLQVSQTVTPGVTNHIKLAIADSGDAILDSDVFIQAGSFTAALSPVLTSYAPFRYAFRDLMPAQYEGNFTIINTGNTAAVGTITLTLSDLPPGVSILSALGASISGNVLTLATDNLPVNSPYRVKVFLANPQARPLGSFFCGLTNTVTVS